MDKGKSKQNKVVSRQRKLKEIEQEMESGSNRCSVQLKPVSVAQIGWRNVNKSVTTVPLVAKNIYSKHMKSAHNNAVNMEKIVKGNSPSELIGEH